MEKLSLSVLFVVVLLARGSETHSLNTVQEPVCHSRFEDNTLILKKMLDIETEIRETVRSLTGQVYHCSETESRCPDGWVRFKESCYLFSTLDKVQAANARDFCNKLDAHLVRIETSEENRFVEDFIRHLDGRHFWLDLTDEIKEGEWIWKSNGSPATFFDWDEGEPRKLGEGASEACTAISTNAHDHYRWIDLPCTWNFASPLCEKS